MQQKQRKFALEIQGVFNEEVARLLKINAIKECKYPVWVANPVVVTKKSGKKHVRIDFTHLNNVSPKDIYPVPNLQQMVDSIRRYKRLTFLDVHSGYHQITMKEEDQIHTAFRTTQGLCCYKVMPFGLKNSGATFIRLMGKMFYELQGKVLEVYVDDIVIKSRKEADYVHDIEAVLKVMNRFKMKLNPEKCSFNVRSRQFLRCVVDQKDIQASPLKVGELLAMTEPRSIKEV